MISVSDAGGIGGPPTENGENVQNAHLIMVVDDGVRQGVHSKASTLMWRSARCKRAINSTLAGETIAMSAALADAEWAQIMIQDILDQTVTVRDTTGGIRFSLKGRFRFMRLRTVFSSVRVAHLAASARHNSLNRFFFPGVKTPSLMSAGPGCLTDVG